MKFGTEPVAEEEVSAPAELKPQDMLEQGRTLCQIGEGLMAAAQAMGAVEPGPDVEGEEAAGQEMSEDVGSEAPSMADPKALKKNAIIIALKKRMGK